MRHFTDQLGHTLSIDPAPSRIISLVPSQTELLADLGLADRVVGITKFCIHPEQWRLSKTIVGGTKQFNFDVIDSLKPDLIIGNKEENYREGIQRLRMHYPVWMSDVNNLDDALQMIHAVAEITSTLTEAAPIIARIRSEFNEPFSQTARRVLYLIWKNPWMAAGSDTFIHDMISRTGMINVLADQPRYPTLQDDNIRLLAPDLVLLSSEPYPFRESHARELAAMLPNANVKLVDGEMFSWYGSRLMKAPAYFRDLLSTM